MGAAAQDVDPSAPIAPSIQSPLHLRVRFEQVTERFGRHVAADRIDLRRQVWIRLPPERLFFRSSG
jgi:hypothetical protein